MPISRMFLDWSRPALPAVVEFLTDRYADRRTCDLGNVVVVLPGSRAGRRLLELLVDGCEAAGRVLTPPRIETVGRLPELLYSAKRPFADLLTQEFAWARALQEVEEQRLRQVIPHPPAADDLAGWRSLGRLLAAQHRELAGDGLDFGDVVRQGRHMDGFDETGRWRVLSRVQQQYLHILDEQHLWDLQTARLVAVEHGECRTDQDIVLVGTVDMNCTLRRMLDQVADRVTALIHAPAELAARFDEHGCLVPAEWIAAPLGVQPQQVRIVDGPGEQAEEVARVLAEFEGRYRADEITIGLADEALVPQISRQLSQCDVPVRWVIGKSLTETAPYQLLACLSDYLERGRFKDFAALVRHPDVCAWLGGRSWLRQLDEYYNAHLPPRLGEWLGEEDSYARIKRVWERVEALAAPLRRGRRSLSDWTEPLTHVLLEVYGRAEFHLEAAAERVTLKACEQIHAALAAHESIPEGLAPAVTAAEAIRLTLEELSAAAIPPPVDAAAVELLGWLELPLDDAPALIVTTFNEGHVPASSAADQFLPNRLRRHLGIDENDRRYARDAYALSVLLASRRDLTLIVARRDTEGNPLRPSRLLFAAEPDTIAARVRAFFQPEGCSPRRPLAGPLAATRDESGFAIPRPEPLPRPLERMNVTAFRTYLACPYRFYLRHVLKLEPRDDEAEELDALLFGSLIHDVLKWFGESELRDSTDAAEIRHFLHDSLDRCAAAQFGRTRGAAVSVQMQQLRARLEAFAAWQADWAGKGWRIAHTEVSPPDGSVRLPVDDGRSLLLTGRIDRIDHFAEDGRWAIFDYKSGESIGSPEKAHRIDGRWIDLQLPLYRHLAAPLGVNGQVQLGYIVLPKDTSAVTCHLADWTSADLQEADRLALEVARCILDEQFWPPADVPPRGFPEFAAICLDTVFDQEELE